MSFSNSRGCQIIVTENYLFRPKDKEEEQYDSLKSVLERTLDPQGWEVKQVSFIVEARSLNEKDLQRNLRFFKVPQTSIESIRSKLAFKLFDEYTNILKGMYSMRFNGTTTDGDIPARAQSDQGRPTPPLITSLSVWTPTKLG